MGEGGGGWGRVGEDGGGWEIPVGEQSWATVFWKEKAVVDTFWIHTVHFILSPGEGLATFRA